VHEIAHGPLGDAPIAHDVLRPAVEADHAVEDARMRRSVQLEKELLHDFTLE
jgi:hypothetical protein